MQIDREQDTWHPPLASAHTYTHAYTAHTYAHNTHTTPKSNKAKIALEPIPSSVFSWHTSVPLPDPHEPCRVLCKQSCHWLPMDS